MKGAHSLFFFFFLLAFFSTKSASQPFKCTSNAKCHALVGYPSPNTTTLSHLQTLFSLKNLRSLLGANNLPSTTLANYTIHANRTVRIPFPCLCRNGTTGVSNKKPNYTVVAGDGLDRIAREVFGSLMNFTQIATVNNLPDPNDIDVGQELWIPLPCSCDEVGGEAVVSYGHVVEAGSSLEEIAQEFGTTPEKLTMANGIANDGQLVAGVPIEVPLQACSSLVVNSSMDHPLLVPNATYIFTANNCVKCKCDAANNWTLHCEPSQLNATNWGSCPSMLCGSLTIGTTTTSGCSRTTCSYAGFHSNQTILTNLVTESTCPSSSGNFALRINLNWSFLLISIHLFLFCMHLH